MFPSLRSVEKQHSFCVPRVCAPKKHHEQQCVRNNVSLFARALRVMITSYTAGCLYMDCNARSTVKDASKPVMKFLRSSGWKFIIENWNTAGVSLEANTTGIGPCKGIFTDKLSHFKFICERCRVSAGIVLWKTFKAVCTAVKLCVKDGIGMSILTWLRLFSFCVIKLSILLFWKHSFILHSYQTILKNTYHISLQGLPYSFLENK